jgi:hypothetical protein
MANKTGAQLDQEIDEVLRMRQKKQAASAAKTSIPSNAEYARRELTSAQKQLQDVRRAPLSDRNEAKESFFDTLRNNPSLVGERISWLFDGNYGYGPMLLAKQSLASKRSNRAAALTQMIGAFEWQVPEEMTRDAWKKLSAREQMLLERVVRKVIDDAEANADTAS